MELHGMGDANGPKNFHRRFHNFFPDPHRVCVCVCV